MFCGTYVVGIALWSWIVVISIVEWGKGGVAKNVHPFRPNRFLLTRGT
jgi:hypothetical protein